MTFEEWADKNNLSEYGKACSRAAWQAAQDNIIKRAWEVFGEDFADDLMEIVDRKLRPEWGEE